SAGEDPVCFPGVDICDCAGGGDGPGEHGNWNDGADCAAGGAWICCNVCGHIRGGHTGAAVVHGAGKPGPASDRNSCKSNPCDSIKALVGNDYPAYGRRSVGPGSG